MIKVICFDLWKTLVGEPYSLEDYWQPLFKKKPFLKKLVHRLVPKIIMTRKINLKFGVR